MNNREIAPNPNQNTYNQINNRAPYVPNQVNQVPNVNQIQNQQNLYQRNLQGQLQPNNKVQYQQPQMPLRQVAQNPIMNQVPQRRINKSYYESSSTKKN